MSSVSSVCRAYGKRMSNVYSIRSHTLIRFEHVQNIHRRMSAYLERTRCTPYVPRTYKSIPYGRWPSGLNKLFCLVYADVICCSVTALDLKKRHLQYIMKSVIIYWSFETSFQSNIIIMVSAQ